MNQRKRMEFLPGKDIIALIIALIAITILTDLFIPGFATPLHMMLVLYSNAALGILALAETYVILTGEIDFSIGSIFWFVTVIGAITMNGKEFFIPLLICLALGVLVGFINGVFSSLLRIPSIISTLAMMIVLTGGLYVITGGGGHGKAAPQLTAFSVGRTFGIPNMVLLWIVLAIILYVIQERSIFGLSLRAIGSNPRAAYCSGMNVSLTKLTVFVISGLLSAIAGLMYLGYARTPYPLFESGVGVGATLSLQSIAAVVIGGTSFYGGKGGVHRTVIGVLLLAILSSALISLGLGYEWQLIFYGVIILIVTGAYVRLMK
ncbi:MAG: ABC transporter permease [Thaumarchaeota archaeon]|nr:ABC transporter permease [Nitrososphaerota archaeon]